MVRRQVREIIREACDRCKGSGFLPREIELDPIIETPRDQEHGDYSTNIAFLLASKVRKNPQEIARFLVEHMDFEKVCDKVEVAAKGFMNFYVKDAVWRDTLKRVSDEGLDSMFPNVGDGRKVLIEFVSSNPTGPLHIGHGRGAAVGDVLANVLMKTGYVVVKEYYVNDAGKQIDTLGQSTYARWRELEGHPIPFEEHFYQGDYVKDIAALLAERRDSIPPHKDEAIRFMARFASDEVMCGIERDLADFGVVFDNYFRETRLYENGEVDETLKTLEAQDYAYEKDGALWFRTGLFERDEDRVLVKSDGEKTYFASDIAYHKNKFERNFDLLIDIWGSDHHGYIPRLRASLEALGKDKESLKVLLIQFVTLLKDGKPVGMSTRSGQFTTLKEVLDEVGRDAARFFFLMRKSDAHLEFDLDLAKKTSNENPVYYVQYAHARIESIFRVAMDEGIEAASLRDADVGLLTLKDEIALIKGILTFFDVVEGSARSLEPHRITFYLLDLVGRFHSYYNKTRVIGDDRGVTLARLLLLDMLRQVIRSGLSILGVSAPERM
ncbi:MAG: Arginine--tRNA ligase [Syntrophorhabdus sp. PtaU1.Bin153]|nr:MAG: Arginine--tRNA ligase [Syntrophorhabdus sp. PtaU1.Bin153]